MFFAIINKLPLKRLLTSSGETETEQFKIEDYDSLAAYIDLRARSIF